MPAAPTDSLTRTPNASARSLACAVLWTLAVGLFALHTLAAQSAPPPRDPSPHSDIVLVSDVASVQPGQTVTVALRLTLDRGWHTYWINPGDAGLPLVAKWVLPAGVTASALQFPTPHLTPQPPLMSYGYENEVLVLSTLQVSSAATVGSTLHIAGAADWLACADVCLPATGPLSLDIPVTATTNTARTKFAAAINATRAQLPVAASGWQVRGWTTSDGYTLVAVPPSGSATSLPMPYFFIDTSNVLEHALPQRVARSGDTLIFALPRAKIAPVKATVLRGVIAGDVASESQRGWNVDASLSATAPLALRKRAEALLADSGAREIGGAGQAAPAVAPDSAIPDPGADMSLVVAIAFAFLGGLLLNLMPCVFPVLSVKVLGVLQHAGGGDASRGRRHGLAFGAGVLLLFWALAGTLMLLRAGGAGLGWGFQLQSPGVVAVLALLMFALGLNLSGVFEIGLSLTRLGGAGAGNNYTDSLLTGALAVIVAAPCTAPFMGAALGFALVQPALIGLLVFTALGVGLALPFVVLTSMPQLLRFLPKPGAWLETLKQLFAFPLYATVVWLLWVFGQQAGIDALAILLLAMIALALGAWLWARGVRSDRWVTRLAAATVGVMAVVIGAGSSRVMPPPARANATVTAVGAAQWQPYSEDVVRSLRAEGRPIFIDFTAAWCLSCQVNERVALRTDAVGDAFARANVALLRADWTSRDDAITKVLASFGRSGVPLYVLYPAGKSGAPSILPAVLTPGIVVDAVHKAAPTTVVSVVR
jgi:thiol:disulfide interchange protein